MKKNTFILFLCVMAFVAPLVQSQETEIFRQEGIASWYGKEFDGRPTASGEIFDSSQLTAAHPTLPFGTVLVVTNRHNNKKVTVRVNDRGPFVPARIVDVSKAAAEQLDMIVTGTAPVNIESVDRIAVSRPAAEPARIQQPVQPVVYTPAAEPVRTQPPVQPVYTPAAEPVQIQPPVYTPVAAQPVVSDYIPQPAPSQPALAAVPSFTHARLTPAINPIPDKMYRLQIGSYKVARNAVETFDKLKNVGLNPAYEQSGDYFRVVLAGIYGTDVYPVTEKIASAGFTEALIREER